MNLRVVGVRAEPPEGPPGVDVELDALVLHPDLDVAIERVWVACVLAAGEPVTACASAGLDVVPPPCGQDPDARLCAIGFDERVTYELPRRALAGRPAGEPGVVLVTLVSALADDGGLVGCARGFEETGAEPEFCRVAVKRLAVVSEGVPARNANPGILDLVSDGEDLTVSLAADAAEPTEDGPEELLLSWFATGGTLKKFRSDGRDGLVNRWTAPEEPGTYRIAVVVRDGRGGEAWRTIDLTVP